MNQIQICFLEPHLSGSFIQGILHFAALQITRLCIKKNTTNRFIN